MSLFVTPAPKSSPQANGDAAPNAATEAPTEFIELTPEQKRARNRRNLMLAFSIFAFVALVFAITIARMKAGAGP
jgi:hypothetical protein